MTAIHSPLQALIGMGRATGQWFANGWRIIHLGAVILVLSLSPSSYDRTGRTAIARQLYLGTAPTLLWFTVLSSLIGVIIIRIVVVTALSYGLSQFALEMVVRVLVLELIPLTSAVFVALRCAFPSAAELARLRAHGDFVALDRASVELLQREALPRVAAGMFSVLLLATVASVVTLVLAYLAVHGFSVGGFASYTRTVGRIFSPAVALIFVTKILLMGLAVAVIPIATVLFDGGQSRQRMSVELQGLVRLFLVILLIEAASLIGNYY